MKKDEIIKAPIEEVTDTWIEFYNKAHALSRYADVYYNELYGDVFDAENITSKKIDEEMELIEQLRPDAIAYLFGAWKMNIKDLEFGNVVKLRDGTLCLICPGIYTSLKKNIRLFNNISN